MCFIYENDTMHMSYQDSGQNVNFNTLLTKCANHQVHQLQIFFIIEDWLSIGKPNILSWVLYCTENCVKTKGVVKISHTFCDITALSSLTQWNWNQLKISNIVCSLFGATLVVWWCICQNAYFWHHQICITIHCLIYQI